MVSDFGKQLRKIRIDNNEVLKDMAKKLGITSAYLSAIENGKRDVPKNYVENIVSLYKLNEAAKEELNDAFEKTIKTIVLDVEKYDDNKRELALKFARTFKNMDDERVMDFLHFIDSGGKKD